VSFDAQTCLQETGKQNDPDINLARVALALAAQMHPGIVLERYEFHLTKLCDDVKARYQALLDNGAEDNAQTQLAALKHILADQEGYEGDTEQYDDLQNADLIRVIDRRKGMPISLSVLYIHVGRANGFDVCGLNFPGHFLCRIEKDGTRVIFDPFTRCEVLEAADLRQLLKRVQGPNAELAPDYYEPASNRDILVRLQNNIKLRLIEAEDYEESLKSVEMMRIIAPDEYRLLFDAGILYAKTGKRDEAIGALEQYLSRVTGWEERADAEAILRELNLAED
jgi:regulator of sirC expression with transglutaminase-like and TPR domain